MKTIDLGTCCADCHAAINYNPGDMAEEDAARAVAAGKQLSALCDRDNLTSLHTGDEAGFSWHSCTGCGSTLGGDRWELFALATERKDT